jgi:thiamine-phosphate pyrophosphorylase
MSFHLPRIYPLTDVAISGMPHKEQVIRLIDGGAFLVQLREKRLSAGDFYLEAESALKVARQKGVQIIINDRVDVALAVGADGVHLGQDDLPPEAARKLLGRDAVIGFSTHSVDQACQALSFPIDYLAVGPIFETTTKRDPDQVIGLEGLRAVRAAIGHCLPLVAIGGINLSNAGAVLRAGADSVALISALLHPPAEISTTTQRLLHCLQVLDG